MGGNKWFDQMAFTEKGKAKPKTRLLRHGKFDWRHSVYGPHPNEKVLELSVKEIVEGKQRISKARFINHYQHKVQNIRKAYGKKPIRIGLKLTRIGLHLRCQIIFQFG